MIELNDVEKNLLDTVSGVKAEPTGAYNVRVNGESAGRKSTKWIEIKPKPAKQGLDIYIHDGTRNQNVHIPVILTASGLSETVYNDFHVGDDCDVVIVAGCGINNCGVHDTQHDGIHRFFIGKNSKVRYSEKHYGEGDGSGRRILNPVTEIELAEGSTAELEMVQIKGVDSTERRTTAVLKKGARLLVREKLMTHGQQKAISHYCVTVDGEDASADIVSRGVARGSSYQELDLKIVGNAPCHGHTECDSIIMDNGKILAVPSLEANCVDAMLVHEAAIGKIASDQLTKLMTMGLTEKEAEEEIINGFLK